MELAVTLLQNLLHQFSFITSNSDYPFSRFSLVFSSDDPYLLRIIQKDLPPSRKYSREDSTQTPPKSRVYLLLTSSTKNFQGNLRHYLRSIQGNNQPYLSKVA